jgi:hypothetical protein
MKKEFIPYELALELKKLGFDEPCFGFYDESLYFPNNENQYGTFCNQPLDVPSCSAPLYQQAFRWFREKYNIDGFVRIEPLNEKYGFVIYNREKDNFKEFSADYNSVEEAELACLNKLIEILKQPKKD